MNYHILNELGFKLITKRKQYRDKATGNKKSYNEFTIGQCKILKEYLNRNEEQKMKIEQAFQENLDEWNEEDENLKV